MIRYKIHHFSRFRNTTVPSKLVLNYNRELYDLDRATVKQAALSYVTREVLFLFFFFWKVVELKLREILSEIFCKDNQSL